MDRPYGPCDSSFLQHLLLFDESLTHMALLSTPGGRDKFVHCKLAEEPGQDGTVATPGWEPEQELTNGAPAGGGE